MPFTASHRRARPSFAVAHASGLWDAPEAAWDALLSDLAGRASVVTLTETTRYRPPAPAGWSRLVYGYGGASECAVYWDGAVWEIAGQGFAFPLSKTVFRLPSGKARPVVHAVGIPLRHRATGRVVVFAAVHFPASIEGRGRLGGPLARVRAFREAVRGVKALRRDLHDRYPGADFVLNADWNLNYRRAWVRALLRRAFPLLRSSWREVPKRGSHGSRLIDGAVHSRRLRTRGSRLLRKRRRFDHVPFVTTYRFA